MTVFGYDHWAATAEATGSANLTFTIPGGAGPGVTASGDGYLTDSILITGGTGTGTLRMVWHVTGSVGVSWSSSDPLGSPSPSPVQLVFNCSGNTTCATQRLFWTQNELVDEIVSLDIPFTFGNAIQLTVSISVVAGTGVNTIFADSIVWQGASLADFGSTGVLQDVVLLDAAGNPLDESGIQAESGFRYDLVGQDVPEPWTALGVPLALAAARARHRRAAI
jgi:hypothetical protein